MRFSKRVRERLTVEVGRCKSPAAPLRVPASAAATNVRMSFKSCSLRIRNFGAHSASLGVIPQSLQRSDCIRPSQPARGYWPIESLARALGDIGSPCVARTQLRFAFDEGHSLTNHCSSYVSLGAHLKEAESEISRWLNRSKLPLIRSISSRRGG
jgi:hypothetical protein